MSPKYIIANWKASQDHAGMTRFVSELKGLLIDSPLPDNVQLIVCPTAIFYSELKAQESELPFSVGLQDVSIYDGGAHTGEVTIQNLKNLEPRYGIVGHSERRRDQGETNQLVVQKVTQLTAMNTTPIICFDEPELPELATALSANAQPDRQYLLAYEPVSAISTSGSAGNLDPQILQERQAKFREYLRPDWSFIYGGSVKPENAAGYAAVCDGLLIGSASLQAESFLAIARNFAAGE